MANLEKANWIAGIAGMVLTAFGLGWAVWTHYDVPAEALKKKDPAIQTSDSTFVPDKRISAGGNATPVAGIDDFVITQEIADLPPDGLDDRFSGVDGPPTYCGDRSLIFRNLSQKPLTLMACVPQTDNCATVAGLAPGERRILSTRDMVEGPLDFFDTEKRFKAPIVIKKRCPA
jgi:hypothetical protein